MNTQSLYSSENHANFGPVQKNSVCPGCAIFKEMGLDFKQIDHKFEVCAGRTKQDVLEYVSYLVFGNSCINTMYFHLFHPQSSLHLLPYHPHHSCTPTFVLSPSPPLLTTITHVPHPQLLLSLKNQLTGDGVHFKRLFE